MEKRLAVASFVVAAVLGAAPSLLAIPAFARRYQVACHFCHEGYPKLNAAGQRFKERGFRMAQEDPFDASAFLRSLPVVLRAQGNHTFVQDGEDTTFALLKGISAGNLGTRLSYWVDDGVLIQSTGDDDVTHTKPDNAWLRVEVVGDGKLYAKAGRFELDIPFTQARNPHLFGYEIYFANTGFETDNIGAYHDGVEVGGALFGDARWSASLVSGRNPEGADDLNDEAGKFDANLFLRARRNIGRHRVGAFAYIGRNTIVLAPTVFWDDNLLRLGVDGSAWVGKLNLYGVAMYGRNDNSIATVAEPAGTQESLSFSGGFLQGDYHLRDDLALTLRLNVVSQPAVATDTENETFTSVFPGIQFWGWEHLKLSFEYGFRSQDRGNVGAIQAEVAF
jgi:hypothetical protein